MQIEIVYRNDPERPITRPVLSERMGFVVRLIRGDLCDPLGDPDGWFNPRPPLMTLRHYFKRIPMPFIAWNLWGWKGYMGAKVYGVDLPAYQDWLPAKEIYPGSQAFCFSFRFNAKS